MDFRKIYLALKTITNNNYEKLYQKFAAVPS